MKIGSSFSYSSQRAETRQNEMMNSIFGGQTDVNSLFTSANTGPNSNQLIAKSMQRELNKLLGYKPDLTEQDSQQLQKLRGNISQLQELGRDKPLTSEQRQQLGKYYNDAYDILGRKLVDVEANPELAELNQQVNQLLERKLRGANLRRFEKLTGQAESIAAQIENGDKSRSSKNLLTQVQIQLAKLSPPRKVNELAPSERKEYDKLVNTINLKADQTVILNSRDRIRADELQRTINAFRSGSGAGLLA